MSLDTCGSDPTKGEVWISSKVTQCDKFCTVKDFKTFATEKQNKIGNLKNKCCCQQQNSVYLEYLQLSNKYGGSDVAIALLIKLLSILKINIMDSYA